MKDVSIVVSSEDSLQIQFPQKICEEVNTRIRIFVENLKKAIASTSGVVEILPTYCAVTVYYEPGKIVLSSLKKMIEEVLENSENSGEAGERSGKVVEIPVCYEDDDFAPDLADIAKEKGLTKEEVIKLHHSKDYLIYMLGFLPGFPYLGGMDERLESPRLETPRTKIPAGSVAIGGKQTGLYPSDSPGGWKIIGRTPLKVFDQKRSPACLYEAGDKIRFIPITKKEFEEIEKNNSCGDSPSQINPSENKKTQLPKYVCTGGIKILDGGMLTTVQDKGRLGFQSQGIGQSGVMDEESFTLGNRLLGNQENAPCLEATLTGPALEFVLPCEFVITGGECSAALDDAPVSMNKKYLAGAGSILKCGFITKGLRSYICFRGGVLLPRLFGSCSTNLKSKSGGYFGRKLQTGDELALGNMFEKAEDGFAKSTETAQTSILQEIPSDGGEPLLLSCTKGSQYSSFSPEAIRRFQNQIFTVLPQSDRMGIRFSGESLNCGNTDIISDAIPFGAVQISSAGLPIVMASDRQTTGGYAKIAAVTKHSMCLLAQSVPGTKVQFKIKE